jgi:hypothetical protein
MEDQVTTLNTRINTVFGALAQDANDVKARTTALEETVGPIANGNSIHVTGTNTGIILDGSGTYVLPSGDVVGTTDVQTVSNKTLDADTTLFKKGAKSMKFDLTSLPNNVVLSYEAPECAGALVSDCSTTVLQNKDLDADTTKLVLGSKDVSFDLSNIASPVGSNSISFPDGDDELVGVNTSQTVSNKNLEIDSTYFSDTASDKKVAFGVDNLTSGDTNTLQFPDVTEDTIVTETSDSILTNKVIVDPEINLEFGWATSDVIQSIPDGGYHTVEFPDGLVVGNMSFANHKFTATKRGLYMCHANVVFYLTAGGVRGGYFSSSGTLGTFGWQELPILTNDTFLSLNAIVPLYVGNTVEVKVYQTSGGAVNITQRAGQFAYFACSLLTHF